MKKKQVLICLALFCLVITTQSCSSYQHTSSTPSQTSSWDILGVILIAMLLGIIGQGIKLLLAWIKMKQRNEAEEKLSAVEKQRTTPETFSTKRAGVALAISILVGAIAGVIAYLNMKTINVTDKTVLLSFVAAGYAGMDFIEAGIQKWLPK